MSSIRSRLLAGLALVAAIAAPGAAQFAGGSYWTSRPSPANLLSISQFGTTLLMRTTTTVEIYSTIKQAWTSIPVSAAALTNNFNDYVIVQDGATFYGWTSRGGVAVLNVGGNANITNGPSSSSWVTVVQDGTTLYGFAAFNGTAQWVPLALASPAPQIVAGSHVVLVQDAAQISAFSSYSGSWQSIPTPINPSLFSSGTCGIVRAAATVSAFSAYRNTWTTASFTATANPTISDSFALIAAISGTQVLAYSSIRGTFAAQSVSPGHTLTAAINVAVVIDGSSVHGYGPGRGIWSTISAPAATATIPGEYALINTGSSIVAFSGLSATFAAPLPGNPTIIANNDCAFAQDVAGSHAYSVLTNTWTPAPPVTITSVQMVRNAAILVTPTGYEAFCARTAQWSTLFTAVPGTFSTLFASATFVARDGNVLNVFDSRLGRWVPVVTASASPAISIWRTTIIASDPIAAYGFGQYSGVWDVVPIVGSVITTSANDAVAYVRTSQFLYVYSGMGSASMLSRYTEFSRFQPAGAPFRLSQAAPAGSAVTAFAALAPAASIVSYPGWGSIYLDLATVVAVLDLGTVPASGLLNVDFAVPDDPALNGVPLHIQDVVIEPDGTAYFTNSVTPIFI